MPPAVPADSPSVATVAESFLRAWGPVVTVPHLAAERCEEVSKSFAAALAEVGIEAEVVSGLRMGEIPEFPGVRLVLGGHFAVAVGGEVWDWTARQFDAEAPCPLVEPLASWRRTWSASPAAR